MHNAENDTSSDVMYEELRNILAPVVVSVIGWHLVEFDRNEGVVLDQGDTSLDQDKTSLDITEKFANILFQRSDGFFLAYHYVRYLLWKSNHSNREKIQKHSVARRIEVGSDDTLFEGGG